MNLRAVTPENLELVRRWRNDAMATLRTTHRLTEQEQEAFYDSLPRSNHRYYDIWDGRFIGVGGITHIQWENRIGEISLILDPQLRGTGLGKKAAYALLDHAFGELNLKTVIGECYFCNTAVEFWRSLARAFNGFETTLPNRKYYGGRYWDSYYFSIDQEAYEKFIQ